MLNKVKLPKSWDKNLAYFCGLILGDGSLPKAFSRRPNGKLQKRHIIHFVSNSIDFINEVYVPLFKKLFGIATRSVQVRKKKNLIYYSTIESKYIYLFLENKGLTVGRKARIAKIPKLPSKYFVYLLAGLLDTDGGKKGSGFGLSTASKYLAKFCKDIFNTFDFSYHSCPWFYNNHTYHQIYIHKKDFNKILKYIPLKNKDKLNFIRSTIASVAQPAGAQV